MPDARPCLRLIWMPCHLDVVTPIGRQDEGGWDCQLSWEGGALLQGVFQLIDHLADRIESRLPKILRSHIDSDFCENCLRRLGPPGTQKI